VKKPQVHLACLLLAVVVAGCEAFPSAEDVVTCAAGRVGAVRGKFSVETTAASWFAAAQSTIVYQLTDSPDRAVVIYSRRRGPITTQVSISYGNHADITAAVAAVNYCAEVR
jgi:hypothetical protein